MLGKLITICGTDACGKSTQIDLLKEYLENKDLKVAYIHFPAYGDNVFSELIVGFLRGEYGESHEVNPYFVANLYMMDQYLFKPKLQKLLEENDVVILDRYFWCNLAFQSAKYDDENESIKIHNWIYQSVVKLGFLYPYLTLCLDVPFETMLKRLEDRKSENRDYLKGKKDIHENDIKLQQRVKNNYKDMYYYNNYRVINCGIKDPSEVFDSYVEYVDFILEK